MLKISPPIPNTSWKNYGGYPEDTGLDINVPKGTKVFCPLDGYIIYSEKGHTDWNKPPDTPFSVLVKLKKPLLAFGVTVNFLWFTHLSKLCRVVSDSTGPVRITKGYHLGYTGLGNSSPHLHFGMIEDRLQTRFLNSKQVAELIWGKREV